MNQEKPILFGVAVWLAKKFNTQAIIIRILFIIFSLAGGAGLLLYFVLFLLKVINKE